MKKKAVIIGASLGIGRECALYLGKKGWIVVVCGRRKNLLDELASTNEDAITIRIPPPPGESSEHCCELRPCGGRMNGFVE